MEISGQKNKKDSVKDLPAATARSFSPLETSLRKTCMNSKALKYNEIKKHQVKAITTCECAVGNKISLRKLREIKRIGDDYNRVNLNPLQKRGISLKGRQSIQNDFSVGLGPASN